MASLKRETRMAMGLDGGMVILGQRASRMAVMAVGQMIALIELAHAFGAEKGVRWSPMSLGGVETTLAYSNQGRHGKGMGIKAHDKFTVPACRVCHYEIDQENVFTKEQKFAFWDAGFLLMGQCHVGNVTASSFTSSTGLIIEALENASW